MIQNRGWQMNGWQIYAHQLEAGFIIGLESISVWTKNLCFFHKALFLIWLEYTSIQKYIFPGFMFKVECSFPRRRRKTVWLDEKVLHLGFSPEIYIEMSISPLLKPFHVSIRLLGSQGTKRAGECECLKAQPHPDPDLPPTFTQQINRLSSQLCSYHFLVSSFDA